MNIVIEGIVVGLSTVVMGTIVSRGIKLATLPTNVPNKSWNRYFVMEIALFLTGFLLHIFFEIAGLNKAYCAYKMKIV